MAEPGGVSGDGVEEREVKLAVTGDFVLPPLTELDGATIVDRGDERLHAVYWDSDDLALANAGVGLRHRNGLWAYKGRSRRDGDAVVREELEATGDGDSIPAELRARVGQYVNADMVHPVARLDTVRHHIDVADGTARAELVHDHVNIVDGERMLASFAEVEVEFSAASQSLADRVVQLLTAAGAVVDPTPKYVRALRALGHDPPEMTM